MSAEDEKPIIIEPGKSAIIRCRFGLGVRVEDGEDGMPSIIVDPSPANADRQDCVALRLHMENIAVAWLQQVAPHRLSDAYRSGY